MELTDLLVNPFTMIHKNWFLLTAQKGGVVNTMTARWCNIGNVWNLPTAIVYIRPQRYTRQFVDGSDQFTLSFFDGDHRRELEYLGRVSGRDEEKIAKSGLHLIELGGQPAFAESRYVFVCRKLYRQPLTPDGFLVPEVCEKNYPQKDYHMMYVGQILHAFGRTDS